MPGEILQIFATITWAGAAGLFVYFIMRPIVNYLINKRNGNEYSDRIKELENFRTIAETNHFHEIEALRDAVRDTQKDLNNFRVEVEKRLTKLESKIT